MFAPFLSTYCLGAHAAIHKYRAEVTPERIACQGFLAMFKHYLPNVCADSPAVAKLKRKLISVEHRNPQKIRDYNVFVKEVSNKVQPEIEGSPSKKARVGEKVIEKVADRWAELSACRL